MQKLRLLVKRIVLAILWPLRRFFDPRFEGVASAAQHVAISTIEATTIIGRSIAELEARIDELQRHVEAMQRRTEETYREATKASGTYLTRLASSQTRDVDPVVAPLLEREGGAEGLAAQRGLWFNPPVWIGYDPGDVVVRGVNERIAEIPYVFSAIAQLKQGARVLDVGASESTIALSLASLGYDVTALDVRPYPFSHPRLRAIVAAVQEWETNERFDAVVCLSTIEHIGLGAYGQEASDGREDIAAMRRIHQLTKPGGLLVLTTRFGEPAADDFQRTYDQGGLDELLEGWSVDELTILRRENETTWVADGGGKQPPDSEAVALVRATREKARARRSSS